MRAPSSSMASPTPHFLTVIQRSMAVPPSPQAWHFHRCERWPLNTLMEGCASGWSGFGQCHFAPAA
ncbi:MAG: hypothetical protein M3Q48_08695 [Actinomycetota bacterium]|nr:hypothetical protein [Actinomycetota bacterium]